MITLEELPEQIQNLSEQDWNRLFSFIPKIEKANSFGKIVVDQKTEDGVMQFPYAVTTPLVNDFYHTIYNMKLVVVFDWMDWTEGREMLEKQAYAGQDVITLCKLLTTIIRADRFSEGYLLSAFKHGDILAILKEMKNRIN